VSNVADQRIKWLPLPDDLAVDEVTDCERVAENRPNAETLFRNVQAAFGSVQRKVQGKRIALLIVDGAKVLVVESTDGAFEVRRSPATSRERALAALEHIEKMLATTLRWVN
jgi:hypothetical protein